MYIWIACDLSDALCKVREECLTLNESVCANEVAFTLPQHLSLKISFEIADELYDSAVYDIREYFENTEPFTVKAPRLELAGNILWLRFDSETQLVKMHSDFDKMAYEKYRVPPHEFDKSFAFHSTLFIDEDKEKLGLLFEKISGITVPESIVISRFIIGASKTGKAGEYQVKEIISAKK